MKEPTLFGLRVAGYFVIVWFLYQHCLELAVIIASLVLYFVSKKQGTVKFRPLP